MHKPESPLDKLEEIGIGSGFLDSLYQMLDSLPLFRDFTPHEIEILIEYMRAYHANAETALIREGESDSYLIVLVSGKARILKDDGHGILKQIATVRSGCMLGEISTIDQHPHSATVITCEPCQLVTLTRYNLDKISHTYPALGVKLLWKLAFQLSSRLRQASGQLVSHL